jgi:hypothetical protein
MAGDIIWYVTMFGCAALFVGIGVYARRLEKPMWFWSGSQVNPADISDVKAYNEENARMWIGYSLWYWAAGVLWIWNNGVGLAALIAGCSVGIAILIGTFQRIEKKYKKTVL